MRDSGRIYTKSSLQFLECTNLLFVTLMVCINAFAVYTESTDTIPFFEPRPNNVSYNVGEKGTLLCSITGLQDRFVVWRRMSEPNPLTIGDFVYSPDRRISVKREVSKNEWNLVISKLDVNDAGVYECAVSSREKYRRLILLRINGTEIKKLKKDRPTTGHVKKLNSKIEVSGRNFVNEGSTITLHCNVTGEDYAPDEVDWFINGIMVNQRVMSRIAIYNEIEITNRTLYSTLEMKHSKMSDSGIYVCRDPYERTRSIEVHVLYEEKSRFDKRDYVKDSEPGGGNTVKSTTHLTILLLGFAVSLERFISHTLCCV